MLGSLSNDAPNSLVSICGLSEMVIVLKRTTSTPTTWQITAADSLANILVVKHALDLQTGILRFKPPPKRLHVRSWQRTVDCLRNNDFSGLFASCCAQNGMSSLIDGAYGNDIHSLLKFRAFRSQVWIDDNAVCDPTKQWGYCGRACALSMFLSRFIQTLQYRIPNER